MSKHRKHKSETIEPFDDKNIKFTYGIPHCHTDISTGKSSPNDALEYGRRRNLDFLIITDHNSYFSSKTNKDDNVKWNELRKTTEKFNKKNEDFVGIIGFEASSNPWGHLNIINPSTCFSGVIRNFNNLMLWLVANGNCYISINHPRSIVEQIPYSPFLNKFINTIEVGNGYYPNKYHRYDKRYFSMLDKGWMLGAINSQDNHLTNFGDPENLTAVLVNRPDKTSIINSLRDRRCYSTESRYLKFYFTINNTFMGSELTVEKDSPLNFYIFAEDKINKIEKIQIISCGGKVIKEIKDLNLFNLKYSVTLKHSDKFKWYVIRILQKDNREALSSPIFVKIK